MKKITPTNWPPTGRTGFPPVHASHFNELIEELQEGTGNISVTDASVSGDLTVGDDVAITGDLTVTGTTTLNGALVLGDAAADALTINATTTYAEPVNYSNATGITAFATGGQASATALTEEINNVTTVATAGDSVKLPAAVAGKTVIVKNSGATALDIFPAASDSIDALAINLAVRIQPGSTAVFRAKDAIVWESNIDETLTLVAPTTNTGALVLKAVASAGNFNTQIQNASQAAARVYTIPDAGANASFVQTEGAQTINGIKTFGSGIVTPAGAVGTPSVQVGAVDTGLYLVSATQTGFTQDGALVGGFTTGGLFTDVISEQVGANGVTIDGALIKDGSFIGKQATATATAAGLTTGALTGTDQFVTVTSAAATDCICLPLDSTCPIGTVIRGWVGANGFELRSNATDTTQTINNVTAGTTNEAAIPATTSFRVEKVASLTWILTAVDEVGAVIAAIIPDSV